MNNMWIVVTLCVLSTWLPVVSPTNENDARVYVEGSMIDLTHTITLSSPVPPWWPAFNFSRVLVMNISDGIIAEGNAYTTPEHAGTHIDAPRHFCPNAFSVHEIPVEQLSGPGVVISHRSDAIDNSDYQVTVKDLQEWESINRRIPDNAILMLDFGWDKFWPNMTKIYNSETMAAGSIHHPGLHPEAAKWLTSNRKLHAVGIDTPSIDYGPTTLFETHANLCRNGKIIIENVANLGKMPPVGSWIFIGAPKLGNGTGTPSRIFAMINSGASTSTALPYIVCLLVSFIFEVISAC